MDIVAYSASLYRVTARSSRRRLFARTLRFVTPSAESPDARNASKQE
jgi:hypothetical protein